MRNGQPVRNDELRRCGLELARQVDHHRIDHSSVAALIDSVLLGLGHRFLSSSK
jgi:hypothetical protein